MLSWPISKGLLHVIRQHGPLHFWKFSLTTPKVPLVEVLEAREDPRNLTAVWVAQGYPLLERYMVYQHRTHWKLKNFAPQSARKKW